MYIYVYTQLQLSWQMDGRQQVVRSLNITLPKDVQVLHKVVVYLSCCFCG